MSMPEDMTAEEELAWLRQEVKRLSIEVDDWKDRAGFNYEDGYQNGSQSWNSFILVMGDIAQATGKEITLRHIPERGFQVQCVFETSEPRHDLDHVLTEAVDGRWACRQIQATVAALMARQRGEDPNY